MKAEGVTNAILVVKEKITPFAKQVRGRSNTIIHTPIGTCGNASEIPF